MRPVTARRVSSGSRLHAGPGRAQLAVPEWPEQSELMVLSLRDHKTAVPASHGRLPDSGRKPPLLRPEPDHSMMADGPPPRATPQAPTAPPCPRAGGPRSPRQGRQPGRTSRPAVPASALPNRVRYSAEPRRSSSRSPRGHQPRIRPKDASDRGPPVLPHSRSCGRSVAALYNAVRPHAALGYKAPAPEVIVPALTAWPAPQPRPAPPAMLPVAPRPTLN